MRGLRTGRAADPGRGRYREAGQPAAIDGVSSSPIFDSPFGTAPAVRRSRRSSGRWISSLRERHEPPELSPEPRTRHRLPDSGPFRLGSVLGDHFRLSNGRFFTQRQQDLEDVSIPLWLVADKGKPPERAGRKATGLKSLEATTAAGLPKRKGVLGDGALRVASARRKAPFVASRRRRHAAGVGRK
jgi:hypothetical protein